MKEVVFDRDDFALIVAEDGGYYLKYKGKLVGGFSYLEDLFNVDADDLDDIDIKIGLEEKNEMTHIVYEELLGKTFEKIEQFGDDELRFHLDNGNCMTMRHEQDCCEDVWLEDIVGDMQDIVGHPILEAECIIKKDVEFCDESCTWTFYKFGTIKGSVTIRWKGESNGYYSETVDFR